MTGPDKTRRGKLWGIKQAIATAVDAQRMALKLSSDHGLPSLDVEDIDRQSGVIFSVS